MNRIRLLENPVQTYAWGSHTAIAELLGQPSPSPRPQAELWMGAHPKAPSTVTTDDATMALDAWIDADPRGVLGQRVSREFERKLPFLMKVLAAGEPLSIQAHPDLDQARAGWARENEMAIDLAAPQRNYRDDNHKPELICALTPFWAINGFRKPHEVAELLDALAGSGIAELGHELSQGGLRGLFERLMTMPEAKRAPLVAEAVQAAGSRVDQDPAFEWMVRLARKYPGDAGVFGPVMLNLACLEPGEAMYLPARRLHAYLDGTGIEIMASSDNVLRGGLTPKHVDVPELLEVLEFVPSDPGVSRPERVSDTRSIYASPAREFELAVIDVHEGFVHELSRDDSVQILLCTSGAARLLADGQILELGQGACVLVEASAQAVRIEGQATIYAASVPE